MLNVLRHIPHVANYLYRGNDLRRNVATKRMDNADFGVQAVERFDILARVGLQGVYRCNSRHSDYLCRRLHQGKGRRHPRKPRRDKLPLRWTAYMSVIVAIILFGAYGGMYSLLPFIYGNF